MWKNYLTVAIRNSWKNKIYVVINVLGLGISMAFCLTIYLMYAFNWEFDDYYKNTDHIFRISELKQNTGRGLSRYDLAPMPMGPRVVQEVPGVVSQTRFFLWGDNLSYEDKVFTQPVGYVDDNFFDFFKIKLKSGSWSSLKDKSRIFLTEETAKIYFGESDAVGKTMTIHYSSDRSVDFTVAGIFDRIPLNSSFYFAALTLYDNFWFGLKLMPEDWTVWQQPTTFLMLKENVKAADVAGQLNKYIDIQNKARGEWKVSKFDLVGFNDGEILNTQKTDGSNGQLRVGMNVLVVFSTMAILIFLIACFNLANTTMALMGNRVREIGVRKVMGGATSQVFMQFMFEMSWTSLLALIMGAAVFQWISEAFFSLWGASVVIRDMNRINLFIAFAGIFILTTVVAGLYPALYSKKFQPVAIFNNRLKLKGSGITSNLLNSLQITFSLMVLVGGLVFLNNAEFLKSLDLGYQKENILNIRLDDKTEFNQMRDKARNNPDINAYASTDDILGGDYQDTYLVLDTGNVEIRSRRVGDGYLELMNIHLKEGRLFVKDLESDYKESVIVNNAYVERFGLKEPIGKLVNLRDGKRYIIGVTGNVIQNLFKGYSEIPEIYLPAREDEALTLVVKTSGEKKNRVFDYLVKSWKEVLPYKPSNIYYQDNMAVGSALSTSNNMKKIFFYLALLGGLLSLTGVFALSTLNVASRTKEIGVRKVMGATIEEILVQMNRKFFILLSASVITGTVLAYFMSDALLSEIYQYHTSVKIMTLVISGTVITAMAFITTTLTILKAAITNPAKILRND
jgi:putative ABC transport system permease protein